MKKIVSLIIVFTLCLSTLTYASNNQGMQWFQGFVLQGLLPENVVGWTNEGVVVARDEGINIMSFDEFNMFIYGNFNAQNVVGNDTRAVDEERPSEPKVDRPKIAIHITPNANQNKELP